MEKYKLLLILIGCGTHKLYEANQSTNMVQSIFRFRADEKMRSCHFIPNKVLFAVLFCDTQFYVGAYYNYCMIKIIYSVLKPKYLMKYL